MAEQAGATIISRRFFKKAFKNEFQSEQLEKPVYLDKDYITFVKSDGTEFTRPAYKRDQTLYPEDYKNYLANKDSKPEGTSLMTIVGIVPSEEAVLKDCNLGTVELLALSTVSQVRNLGDRYIILRDMAQGLIRAREDVNENMSLRESLFQKDLELLRLKKELYGKSSLTGEDLEKLALSGEFETGTELLAPVKSPTLDEEKDIKGGVAIDETALGGSRPIERRIETIDPEGTRTVEADDFFT